MDCNLLIFLVLAISKFCDGKNYTKLMYEDAALYSSQSDEHQKEAKYLLDKFGKHLKWGEEKEKILDIGCGTGDVTTNVLLPFVESHSESIVGIDYNPKMIQFANKKWDNVKDKVSFNVTDITAEDISKLGKFDKIFSFFALQWVKDQFTVGFNINALLNQSGQAFLVIVAKSELYFVWDKITKMPKWRNQLKQAPPQLNQYCYLDNPTKFFTDTMFKAGLVVDHCELLERKAIFTTKQQTDDEIEQRIKTVDPFVYMMPQSRKKEYMKDIVDMTKKMIGPQGATDYTALVAVVSKKSNQN